MLGTPHEGAPLEQVTNAATAALARLPETRPLAKALNIRSSGIKDLRYGYLVDECWMDQDCDAFLLDGGRTGKEPVVRQDQRPFRAERLDHPVGLVQVEDDAIVLAADGMVVLHPITRAQPVRGKLL
jgi:hypothetical protein